MDMWKIEELNENSMRNVCDYFSCFGAGTTKDIGTNGSFMRSLCKRDIARVVGKKEGDFFPVGDGLYRKSEVNIYSLNLTSDELWQYYVDHKHEKGKLYKEESEMLIDEAQARLDEAKRLLQFA